MSLDLSTYLKNRGIDLDPTKIDKDPVMDSTELLKEASDLWNGKENLITMVIQARVNAIMKYMIEKAQPEETIVMRQSLVEIGAIISDFQKYNEEQLRREAKKNANNEEKPQVVNSDENETAIL